MKNLVISGIILIVALLSGTWLSIGDAFNGDDYINVLTLVGAITVITITVFVVIKYVNQMKNDNAKGELSEENWDGIGEYKNPIPTGWAIMFVGTIVYMLYYMTILYPINNFSQIGQWNEETLDHNDKFKKVWENPSKEDLTAMGQSTFLVQCAPCHGATGEGINGKAHNLTKRINKKQVLYVINNGANNLKEEYPGGMPAGMAFGEGAEKVAEYVAGGFKGEAPAEYMACAGCHGMDGKGMPYVAPNIREYDDALISSVLNNGKKGNIGMMPSFKGRLNETQQKALAEYIKSIGE